MREKKNKSRFKFKPNVACHPVEKIIGFYTGKEKRRYYRVQWAPSWVPEEYLVACENLIKQFFVEENIINKDSTSSSKCEVTDFPLKTEDENDNEGSTEDAPKSITIDDEIPILIEADDNIEEANYVKFELKDAAKQNIAEKTDGAKEVEDSQNTTEDSDSSSCEECQSSSTKVPNKQGSRAMMGSPPITDMKEKTKLPITSCSKDKIENSLRELKNKRIELEIRKRIRDLKVNSPEKMSKNRTTNFVPSCVTDTETVNIPSCVIEETQDDTSVEMPSRTSDNTPSDQNIDQPSQDVPQNVTELVLTPEKVLEVQTFQETDPEPILQNYEPESLPNIPGHLLDHISNQSTKDIPQDIPKDIPTHEPANTPDIIPEPETNPIPQNELINLTVKKEFVDDRKNKTYETRQRMRTLVDDDSSSDSDVPLCNLIPQSIVIKRPAFASLKSTPSKDMVHIKEELLNDKNSNECNVNNFTNDHNTETKGHSGALTINSDDRTDNFDVNDLIDHSNFYDNILELTTVDNNIPIVIEDDPTPLDETNGNNSNDKLHNDCENTDPIVFSDTTSDAIDSYLNNDTNDRNDIDSKINKSNDFVENGSRMKNTDAFSASSPHLENMTDDKTKLLDNNDQDSKKKKNIPLDDTDKTDSNGINIENKISHKPSDTSLKTNTITPISTSPSPKKARGRPRKTVNPNNNEDTKIIIDDKTSTGVDSTVVSPYQKHDDVNDSKVLIKDSVKVQTAGDVGISEATFEDSNSCASGIGNAKTNETSSCSSFEFNKDAVSKLLLSFGSTRGKRGRGRPCKMFSPEILKTCKSNDNESNANGILNSELSEYNAAHHSFVPITSSLSKRGRSRSRKIIKPEYVETNRFHEKGTSNVDATSSSFVRIISPPTKRGRRRKGFNSICIKKNSTLSEKSISILDNSTFDNAPTDINATSDSFVRIISPPTKRGRRRKGFNSICIEKNSTLSEKSISILDNSTFDNAPTDINATSDSFVRIISPPSKRGRRRKGFNSICIEKNSTLSEKSISILDNSTFDNAPTDINATSDSSVRIISPPSKRGRPRKIIKSECVGTNTINDILTSDVSNHSATTEINATSNPFAPFLSPLPKRGRKPRKSSGKDGIQNTVIRDVINEILDNAPSEKSKDTVSKRIEPINSSKSKRGPGRPHKIFSPEGVDDKKTIMCTEMSSNVVSALDSPNKAHDTQCNNINNLSKDITQKLTHPLKTEAVDDVHTKTAYRGRGRPRRSDDHVSNRTLNRHLNGVSKNMLSLKTEVGEDGNTNTKYRGRGRPRRSDCYVRKTAFQSKSRFKLLYGENEPIKIKCTNPDTTQGYSNIKEEPLSPPSNFKSFSTEMSELNKHTSTKPNEDPIFPTELSTNLNESSNNGKIVNDPIKNRNTESDRANSHSQSYINESSPTAKSKTTQLTSINDTVCTDNSTRKGTGSEDDSFSDDSDDSDSEKVFECDVCEEKFQSSVLLHRHRFIHCENQPFSFTKPKPLRCKIPRHIDVIRCKAKTKMSEGEKKSIGDCGKGKKLKESSLRVRKVKDSKPRKISKGEVKLGKTSNCKVRKIKQGRLKVGKIGKITGENCKVSKIRRNKKALKEEDSIAKAIKIEEVSTQMKEHGDDCGDNKAIEDGPNSKDKGDSQFKSGSDEDSVPLASFDKSDIGNVPLDGLAIKKGRKVKDKSNTEEAKKVKLADRVSKELRT